MKVLAAFVVLIAPSLPARSEPIDVDVALVFVVDISESMTSAERTFARQAHAEALVSVEVLSAVAEGEARRIAAAYVEFASTAQANVGWTLIATVDDAARFGTRILASPDPTTSNTGIGAGVIEADRLFSKLPYRAGRLVIDVVGDGTNNAGFPLDVARAAVLSRGATINGMPLVNATAEARLATFYRQQVIGGPWAFSLPIRNVSDLPMALRSKIVLELY